MIILSKKTEETLELGKKIGKLLVKEGLLSASGSTASEMKNYATVIALEGDLGGGKTTFTKGLAKGLGIKEDITSPSFTLEKVYQLTINNSPDKLSEESSTGKQLTNLYHFDFYRIDNPKDMVSYELMEALNDSSGIVVIEWAEKIEAELPREKLIVKFEYVDENTRKIVLKSFGKRYKEL